MEDYFLSMHLFLSPYAFDRGASPEALAFCVKQEEVHTSPEMRNVNTNSLYQIC